MLSLLEAVASASTLYHLQKLGVSPFVENELMAGATCFAPVCCSGWRVWPDRWTRTSNLCSIKKLVRSLAERDGRLGRLGQQGHLCVQQLEATDLSQSSPPLGSSYVRYRGARSDTGRGKSASADERRRSLRRGVHAGDGSIDPSALVSLRQRSKAKRRENIREYASEEHSEGERTSDWREHE